jgi:hypothetical protein
MEVGQALFLLCRFEEAFPATSLQNLSSLRAWKETDGYPTLLPAL